MPGDDTTIFIAPVQGAPIKHPKAASTRRVAAGIGLALAFLILALLREDEAIIADKACLEDPSHDGPAAASPFVGGTSGKLFLGKATRAFPQSSLIGNFVQGTTPAFPFPEPRSSACHNWAVVTTIFDLSLAIKKTLALGDSWCTVVVADQKTPTGTYDHGALGQEVGAEVAKRIVLLTVEDQETLGAHVAYAEMLPWNHFGRKNLGCDAGFRWVLRPSWLNVNSEQHLFVLTLLLRFCRRYLYAVGKGAQLIFDFDDDNILIDDDRGQPVSPAPPSEPPDMVQLRDDPGAPGQARAPGEAGSIKVFNPYPAMGAASRESWPRGIPLDHVTRPATFEVERRAASRDEAQRVAVWQSLANRDPDVDAIYRLTNRMTHFDFDVGKVPLALPPFVVSPYNAQATTHAPAVYFGLLLPTTVPGRVSDIWRSYITQRIMWECGLGLAFRAPVVFQERSPHSFLADMDSERDLYFKATRLVHFLGVWTPQNPDGDTRRPEPPPPGIGAHNPADSVMAVAVPVAGSAHLPRQAPHTDPRRPTSSAGLMELLYADLYERGYVELADVEAAQLWLQALADLGYRFPPLVKRAGRP